MAKIIDPILKKEYALEKGRSYIIGRNSELSDIVIPLSAGTVSRIHGLIRFYKTWQYMDLKSDSGTKINTQSCRYETGSLDLENDDIIKLASNVHDKYNKPYELIFKDEK